MRFGFTEEQLAFRDAVRDLLEKECPPDAVRAAWDPAGPGYDAGLWRRLAEMGVLGILAPELLAKIATDDGSPALGRGYESSVCGLHFVGSAAVRSYGPLLRFVWGAGYAARTVTRFVCANRTGPAHAWSQPCPEEVFTRPTETASNLS
jgi:alkylation response protein AidB-like acyl-CoA dehydrogenase